jgi:hypothetical protein
LVISRTAAFRGVVGHVNVLAADNAGNRRQIDDRPAAVGNHLTGPDLFVEVDSAMLVPFPKSRIVRRQQRIVRTGPEAA